MTRVRPGPQGPTQPSPVPLARQVRKAFQDHKVTRVLRVPPDPLVPIRPYRGPLVLPDPLVLTRPYRDPQGPLVLPDPLVLTALTARQVRPVP